MRHVLLAMPCYTGAVLLKTFESMLGGILALGEVGAAVSVRTSVGNAMIGHARSLLVADFLADKTMTDLVFIDSDVSFEPYCLIRLLSHPVDIVAGLYPKREEPLDFHVCHVEGGPGAPDDNGLVEVAGVPAGFWKISRQAIEKMVDAYPETRFKDDTIDGGYGWALFDNIRIGETYFGEDYAFCKRWGDIGGKIYIDPQLELTHTGLKQFTGTWGEWHGNRSNDNHRST